MRGGGIWDENLQNKMFEEGSLYSTWKKNNSIEIVFGKDLNEKQRITCRYLHIYDMKLIFWTYFNPIRQTIAVGEHSKQGHLVLYHVLGLAKK